ncbi:MAG: hypothetical protein J7J44_02595 [Deltaproteobacteria bacterium]|nr:hypothetical protein [Deltaproteobacteria bacterium]
MIDWIAILYLILLIPLHELSHYLVMRHHGIKGKFKITLWWIGFEVKDWHVSVNTPEELNKAIQIIAQVYSSGCLLPTIFGILLSFFTGDIILWQLITLELLYSIYEVGTIRHPVDKIKEE